MPVTLAEARDRGDRFSEILARHAATVPGDRVELGTIARLMGRRSIGALLLFLALPMALPIPAPGLSVLFGVPMILVSAQLLLGRRRAWLPARLARRSVSRSDFTGYVQRALPLLRRLERMVRPRLGWLAGDWAMIPVGAVCLGLALIITLPIPLGHVVPGTAISLLALGMMERDGLAIGLGLATAAIAVVIITLASLGIANWLHGFIP
jgi:hypothetical protein